MRFEFFRIGAESFMLDAETLAQVHALLRTDKSAATALARRKGHRTLPDGASFYVPKMLTDAAPPSTTENSPMTTTTVILDGQSIAVDPRVAAEMERLRQGAAQAGIEAALRHHQSGGRPAADHVQAAAIAAAAREAMIADQVARRALGTPRGDYIARLSNAWRNP